MSKFKFLILYSFIQCAFYFHPALNFERQREASSQSLTRRMILITSYQITSLEIASTW